MFGVLVATGATSLVVIVGIAVALALLGLSAWALARERRRRAVARDVRDAIVAELARDPALSGLALKLAAYTEWQGTVVLELGGVVPSPWYRYAVVRAVQRALARDGRPARVVDRLAVGGGNGITRKSASA